MEKIKAKVEQVLHKDNTHNTYDTPAGTTTGHTTTGAPHGAHPANPIDPTYSTGTTGTTGMTGTHGVSAGDPTGPHKSHLSNKADPRVDSDNIGGVGNTRSTGGYGGSDPRGPHDSAFANKLDPRVDTDQVGGYGNTAGAGGGYKGSDPTGPHDSRLANKLDPRVDSDNYGGYGNTQSTGGAGRTNLTGQHTTGGLTGNQNTTGGLTGNQHTQYSDPTGPHDSHLGNKADPRVDSDRVGLAGNTQGTGGYGHTGTHHTTGGLTGNQHTQYSDPTGPHDSHLGNTMDPRVDSDRVGPAGNTRGAGGIGHTGAQHTTGGLTGGTHTGVHNGGHLPGPADKTAGPHKSDMLNKLDPRVDADLDGSKTMGGNRTYG